SWLSGLEPARWAGNSRRQARKGTGDLAGRSHGVKLSPFGRVFAPDQERRKRPLVRRTRHAPLGDDGGDVARRRHVEGWIEDVHAFGCYPRSGEVGDLGRRALLDGDLAPARRAQADAARRGG